MGPILDAIFGKSDLTLALYIILAIAVAGAIFVWSKVKNPKEEEHDSEIEAFIRLDKETISAVATMKANLLEIEKDLKEIRSIHVENSADIVKLQAVAEILEERFNYHMKEVKDRLREIDRISALLQARKYVEEP